MMERNTKERKKSNDEDSTREVKDMLISNLPHHIILHILSFLDMKHVVRTSILSRRWRHLWKSLQYLNFDHNLFSSFYSIGQRSRREQSFTNFVSRVLLLRNHTTDIVKFNISCDEHCCVDSLATWILVAISYNIQELQLQAFRDIDIRLPREIYTCNSLQTLKLKSNSFRLSALTLPGSVSLPLLKYLSFESISFMNDKSISNFLSGCPVLENLFFDYCNFRPLKYLLISSLQLKELVIDTDDDYDSECHFKIDTPNLKYFRCGGSMRNEYTLLDMPSLDKANIGMRIEDEIYIMYDHMETDIAMAMSILRSFREEYAQRMMKILRSLGKAKALTLSPWTLEFASGAPAVLEQVHIPFCNLRCLRLTTMCSTASLRLIRYLLENSPIIEALVMELMQQCCPSDIRRTLVMKSFYSRSIGRGSEPEFTLCHLKSVEISNFLGCENELRFLKFLMKNATKLEKVIITSSNQATVRQKMKWRKKIKSFLHDSPHIMTVVT
ncbi:PREDICTED: F-box/LRR-repeat protein At3g26922-like [Nelumbo nucifera]|uniref:F-box/LRR-repeat protein At3g26922-like n=2 Tax=Nelumbo nucifera TaxID=4432 RepID=A0A1U8BL14_NELNU|nr:PREDICTED: F-box/LRR-repeat protein At3g26922-like [Nelumbo nucifera]DAD20796.1 TPA_asm: hypothetical protein HUJ06_022259 [Nelumbo nucifera]